MLHAVKLQCNRVDYIKQLYSGYMEIITKQSKRYQLILDLQDIGERIITIHKDLKLKVSKQVLVPHIHTLKFIELLHIFISKHQIDSCVDLGTGTGVIAIEIKHRHPNLKVLATDTSPKAVELAGENAKLNNVSYNVILQNNSNRWMQNFPFQPDLIISNPPYLSDKEFFSENTRQIYPEMLLEPEDAIRNYSENRLKNHQDILIEFLDSSAIFLAFEFSKDHSEEMKNELEHQKSKIIWEFCEGVDGEIRYVFIQKKFYKNY